MIGVFFQVAIADGERLPKPHASREFQRWPAPCERHSGPGHERDFHLPDRVVHALRVGPFVGEVFVVVERHHAPVFPEHPGDLFKIAPAGILEIAARGPGIGAVLSDAGYAVDS